MFEIKDSGSREEFSTGSKRDVQTGKPRYELIPIEPLHDLAMHYTNGAVKYGDDNWRKGQPIRRMFASLMRHVYAYLAGVNDGEDHGSAIAWNSFAIKWTRLQIKAGKLPWELEDVFTDEQFVEFYGQPRDRVTPSIPVKPAVPVTPTQKDADEFRGTKYPFTLDRVEASNLRLTQELLLIAGYDYRPVEGVYKRPVDWFVVGEIASKSGIPVSTWEELGFSWNSKENKWESR